MWIYILSCILEESASSYCLPAIHGLLLSVASFPLFVLSFALTIIYAALPHPSKQTEEQKQGRPGNEAMVDDQQLVLLVC